MLHFESNMLGLIAEIARVLPEFQNVKIDQVRVSATFNRKRTRSGLIAYLLPMKFKDGSPIDIRVRGQSIYHYAMPPLYQEENEVLYLIYFMLPRFLNLTFEDKLDTVIHEMYHIHPDFNGDFRRLKGRSYLHGDSLKAFDQRINWLTQKFLASDHNEECYQFLKWNHWQVRRRFGGVVASHFPEPKPKLLKIARHTSESRSLFSPSRSR